jgi:hypothetical protein
MSSADPALTLNAMEVDNGRQTARASAEHTTADEACPASPPLPAAARDWLTDAEPDLIHAARLRQK